MLRERKFLLSLTETKSVKVAKKASSPQIDLVCHIIFYLCQGDIPLSPQGESELKRTRKMKLLNEHFTDVAAFKRLLRDPHLQKIIVVALKSLYRELFYFLFH